MSFGTVLGTWNSDRTHSDKERWICIYPAYINSKKTLAQGRKINKSKCVENPTYQEIYDALTTTGLQVGVENKLYSRERSKEPLFRGRIRVHMKHDDGTPIKEEFATRETLLEYAAMTIPKLKSRQVHAQPVTSTGAASKKGKGGKKRR